MKMKYRFYHEWLYQIAKFAAVKCNAISTRCLSVMKKMHDREVAYVEEMKRQQLLR